MPPRMRTIRVVCPDGDPAKTKLLDLDGKPIPEAVKRATITIEPGELARGTFLCYKAPRPGHDDEFDTFEAEVVLGAA